MFSSVQRDEAYIRRLRDFIGESYLLQPTGITPARRGYFGETWRVDCGEDCFFAKLVHGYHAVRYQRSFPVIDHLCAHGIDSISRIVKTRDGGLYTYFEGGVLGLFDWIEGENREDDSTKPHEYQILARIYAVDPTGLNIPREDFSARAADHFFECRARVKDEAILALLEHKREEIEQSARRLRHFSERCAGDGTGFAITHGDAGGNVLVRGDSYRIIDWDISLLAPPERDAWFWMHRPWAMEAFHSALRQNGIRYTLRPDRLAYYCYHMYFYYLNEILDAHFALGGQSDYLADFLDGWMNDNRAFCERTIQ